MTVYYTRVFDVTPGSTNLSQPVEDEFLLIQHAFANLVGDHSVDLAAVYAALALKATLASPTFTGTPRAPTAGLGDSSTQLATTAFVQGVLGASGALLPPQTGNAGRFLKTDGTSASWADVAAAPTWADIGSKPTTLEGFGITNAQHALEIATSAGLVATAPSRIRFDGMTVKRQGDAVVVAPQFPHHLLLAQGII